MGVVSLDEKVAVLGIGNILLKDEGVGVRAVEALKERFDFPESVELIDGGTMGLDLLPFIEGKDKVLIVDAVNLGKDSGTIAIIEDGDIPSFLSSKLSVHQIGLPDVLYASKLLGIMPSKMALIGIQPETIETGLMMSETLNRNFERLLNTVIEKLNFWGIEIKCKS